MEWIKADGDMPNGSLPCDDCQPSAASAGLAGEQRDIVVTINHGLDEYDIEFIQQIEKHIDAALAPVGFTRSTSTKGGKTVEFVYWQFGQCL
jgi:hypothetical protein